MAVKIWLKDSKFVKLLWSLIIAKRYKKCKNSKVMIAKYYKVEYNIIVSYNFSNKRFNVNMAMNRRLCSKKVMHAQSTQNNVICSTRLFIHTLSQIFPL